MSIDVGMVLAMAGLALGATLVSWWRDHRALRNAVARKADLDELVVCGGCVDSAAGCSGRHRAMWMDWTPDGLYRCTSCCAGAHGIRA